MFDFERVPDPAGGIGEAMTRQSIDTMPSLIKKYGTDAVYFTTNTALYGTS